MCADATRILVADNNFSRAEQVRDLLESRGYAVDWAADGDHALAMAATGVYRLMLLNAHMPVYDGVEVMRRLHLLAGRKLKVIAITADLAAPGREELSRMGIDGYLTNPEDFERLVEEVERVLGGQ